MYTSVPKQHGWTTRNRHWEWFLYLATIIKRIDYFCLTKQPGAFSSIFYLFIAFKALQNSDAVFFFSTRAVYFRRRGRLITRGRDEHVSVWLHGLPAAKLFFLPLTLTLHNDVLFSFNQRAEEDLPCGVKKGVSLLLLVYSAKIAVSS